MASNGRKRTIMPQQSRSRPESFGATDKVRNFGNCDPHQNCARLFLKNSNKRKTKVGLTSNSTISLLLSTLAYTVRNMNNYYVRMYITLYPHSLIRSRRGIWHYSIGIGHRCDRFTATCLCLWAQNLPQDR